MSHKDRKEYHKNYNKAHPALAEKARLVKAQLVSFYGNVCADCGNVYPPCCYDFHHIEPKTKGFEVSGICVFEKAFEESKKCVMICSNCHRIRQKRVP
jgi:hypothetical protein